MRELPEPRELVRLARAAPGKAADLLAGLSLERQAEAVLAVRPAERVEVLLAAPRPMRLVRSIPDGDLYLTIREAGPSDALPVIALASPSQLTHLFDLESWRADRFDAPRAGAWAAVLLESGEVALRRFARTADDALLTLLFRGWARARPIETDDQTPVHGAGATEAGDERGFSSPCGYYRFDPRDSRHAPAVRRLAELLFLNDSERYFRLLWSTVSESDAEIEDDGLRWRTSRLEEHGFPPYDEAWEIYALPSGAARVATPAILDAGEAATLAPRWGEREVGPSGALASALALVPAERAEAARRELVATAARIVVADGLDAGDPAAHHAAARKAAAYAQVGLEVLSRDLARPGGDVLAENTVLELFRHGHARIAGLARRAHGWFVGGWPHGRTECLQRLDEPLATRVELLLATRPAFVEIGPDGLPAAVRDFESESEVAETAAALELAESLGNLFEERLGCGAVRAPSRIGEPRYSTLLLTSVAWHATRRRLAVDPLPAEVVADFLRTVASRRTAAPDAAGRALEAWVDALGTELGLEVREVALALAFGRSALERLAAECGALDPGIPVDGRQLSCLLLDSQEAPLGR